MNEQEVIKQLQEKLFSKIDETIQKYVEKDDTRRATAFAFKMKESVNSILEILESMNFHSKTEKEKEEILTQYHKKMEDMIPIIKQQVEEAIERESKIPSYIGFIGFIFNTDERRFEQNEKNS